MQDPRHQSGPPRTQGAPSSDNREAYAEPAGDPRPHETESLSDLFSGVVENLQNIIRYEVQLAKVEIREEAKVAGKGIAMLAGAALVGFYALGLFLLTAVWALATQVDRWLAALIVAVVVAAVAGILAMVGKKRLEEFSPKPEETIESVKEDIEWVKQQTP